MRPLRRILIGYDCVLTRGGDEDSDVHRGKRLWIQGESRRLYTRQRGPPSGSGSWTSSLQGCGQINIRPFSSQLWCFGYGSPGSLEHRHLSYRSSRVVDLPGFNMLLASSILPVSQRLDLEAGIGPGLIFGEHTWCVLPVVWHQEACEDWVSLLFWCSEWWVVSHLGQPDLSIIHFPPIFHLMGEESMSRYSISLGL